MPWPYAYFGQNEDPRQRANDMIWYPKRWCPTWLLVPILRHWACSSTKANRFRVASVEAHSSDSTGRGTDQSSADIAWHSFLSRMGNLLARLRTS